MAVSILLDGVDAYIKEEDLKECSQKASQIQKKLLEDKDESRVLGWRTLEESAVGLDVMRKKAEEIRKMADVFVIVGVGGSNQAARAMIEALKEERKGPEILYLGNTLSPYTISHTLEKLEGKSVYIDVIAKNFETLEPGSHFRILRQWMRKRYTKQEMANRIIVTGTVGSRLEEIAKEQGYLFLQFPVSVGGRYSAFTPVGLFPIMVAGLDEREFLNGVLMAMEDCKKNDENKDKWIGIGGHFEEGESPEDCLLREAKEETGLTLTSWKFRGIVTFVSDVWGTEYMCLYTADGYTGEMISCNEGVLEWIKKEDLLKLNLWEGDKIFLKLLQENAPFFSLKLVYKGDELTEAVLNGENLKKS